MTETSPTIYLTNASSRRAPFRGPSGRVYTIMAAPRVEFGECGDGVVADLVPSLRWVLDAKSGVLPFETYRELYLSHLARVETEARLARTRETSDRPARPGGFEPGRLVAEVEDGDVLVESGDTLVCACSRADAIAGRCHRAWAAIALLRAGWLVVLDGILIDAQPELFRVPETSIPDVPLDLPDRRVEVRREALVLLSQRFGTHPLGATVADEVRAFAFEGQPVEGLELVAGVVRTKEGA
jgi:hypothetical protein